MKVIPGDGGFHLGEKDLPPRLLLAVNLFESLNPSCSAPLTGQSQPWT
jgi:hypothetical protein